MKSKKRYHGAREGYTPPPFKDINGGFDLPLIDDFRALEPKVNENAATRNAAQKQRVNNRTNHRKRNKHGRVGVR